MKELSIDIETYSSVDLMKSGVYAYCDAPDFTILLFAYAFDNEPVQIVDLEQGEKLPELIISALTDSSIIKSAFNANFEITCIRKYLGIDLDVSQWRCSQVAAAELGLPQSLDMVAKTLGLAEQKDKQGKSCINYFSKPCKALSDAPLIKANRHLPSDDMAKWETFKNYCKQDVEVERAIKHKISKFSIADSEQRLWEYDQRISDRGCRLDTILATNAINFGQVFQTDCMEKAKKLTGLDNPNSVTQLKDWLEKQTGESIKALDKKAVGEIISKTDSPLIRTVLKLRSDMAKTSNKKYEAMLSGLCSDERLRGFLKFYGANRTGRWAGRNVQVQNLPQNHLKDLEFARSIVRSGDYELFEMLFGRVPHTLSELIRTAFIPSEGCRFIVSDFSAIEARVVAYLAGESWRLDVFRTHGKIYEASASQMFGVPVEEIKKGSPLRQKGKIAELALGYGGSVGALKSMGALEMGLYEDELQPLVDSWRTSNPAITRFWKDVERAALNAVNGKPSKLSNGIGFYKSSGILFVKLPSGRSIAYVQPQIKENKFGRPALTYMGVNQTKKSWERIETFGGKLVENIVQAFARDCLAENIIRLEDRGFRIVFHVHDEVIIDAPYGFSSDAEVAKIMGEPIEWAKGLPLRADAYETDVYRKD